MARIRTIKPEFPQSETVGKLSRDARLLFVQLWTIVDDAGRTRAASRMLASLLYPYDDDAKKLIERWLEELEQHSAIRRYEVDGSQYLEIVKWLDHQKIDRPSPSRLPAYREGEPSPREESRASDADLVPSTCTLDLVPAAGRDLDLDFKTFVSSYPKRKGSNPLEPAKKKFFSLVKSGVDPEMLIAGARREAREAAEQGRADTPYVPQMITWLNQSRWTDAAAASFLEAEAQARAVALVHIKNDSPQWEAWTSFKGKSQPVDKNGGWYFEAEWPPGYRVTS